MTNPRTTTSSPRATMLRALLLAPVTIGVLAGTAVAGAGICAAEPAGTGSAGLGADTPQSKPGYTWSLTNGTDQPIWGELTKQNGEYVSRIERSQGDPLLGRRSQQTIP